MLLVDIVPDRVHEVGLAETDAAVDEQRVVRLRRVVRNGERRGVRKAVRLAANEGVERVFGDQRGAARRGALCRGPRLLLLLGHEANGKLRLAGLAKGLFDHGGIEPLERVPVDGARREQNESTVVFDPQRRERRDPVFIACFGHLRLQQRKRF